MATSTSRPARWLCVTVVIIIALGIAFRFSNAAVKIYYQDEAITSVRVAGYTLAEFDRLFDGVPRSFDDVQAFMRPAPGRGVAAVVHSLAAEDPQHPPMFYVLEAIWTRAFGSSPLVARTLPVLLSLLALPLVYLIAVELFASRAAGWAATALAAVSPFFVLYAYQAREYGLLTVAVCLASMLYLRAERTGRRSDWLWYAFSVAFGLYTYLLFVIVIVSHAIAAAIGSYRQPRKVASFLMAAIGGTVLAAPWLLVAVVSRRVAASDLSWATSPSPFGAMVAKWGFYAASTFFDLEYAYAPVTIVAIVVLVCIVVALVSLIRERSRATVFLAALGGTTFFGLAIVDLIERHRFSTVARYLTPTWLALLLIVAGFVGTRSRTWPAKAMLAVLVGCGIASNAVSSRSASWWENNGNKAVPQVAARLNSVPGVLVVSLDDYGPLLGLAPVVRPSARWLGYGSESPPRVALTSDATTYLLSPPDTLRARLSREHIALRMVYDSHDFSSNLTRFRVAAGSQHPGDPDWGEMVLWQIDKRGHVER